MCAINGFTFNNSLLLKKMMSYCENRGPDFNDFYNDENISIGHNRLSILDISKRSNQPYIFKNLILSFNGEIYNFKELRHILEQKGYKFETNSDTEVLIKLFYEYETEAFKKLSGIFSISIWDKNKNILYLIRDIVGVKPLYYKIRNGKFFFSSLIKPLLINENKDLNLDAANYYNNFGYNDLRETFFKNIFKVLPGELITFKNDQIKKEKFLKFNFFKDISNKLFREKIENIVKKQSISDVPISLSLSGGVDSNIILSSLNKKITTYTVSFKYKDNKSLDSHYALQRANEYNTDHNELYIDEDDFMNSLEHINDIIEEPIANENMVGNYFLSKKIKEKVILVGDGGDEIFSGYNKYRSIYLLSIFNRLNFLKFLKPFVKNKNLRRFFFNNPKELHLSFSNQNIMDNRKIYKKYKEINYNDIIYNHFADQKYKLCLSDIMLADIDTWIQNDVLIRNDKIYMNEGIEVRVPFLDQEMIETFLYYDEFKKINILNKTKPLLRKLFKNKIDNVLSIKKGFVSPFQLWINNKKNLDRIKFFFSREYYFSDLLDYELIKLLLTNASKHHFQIFSLLMFQIFLKKNNF